MRSEVEIRSFRDALTRMLAMPSEATAGADDRDFMKTHRYLLCWVLNEYPNEDVKRVQEGIVAEFMQVSRNEQN